MNTIQATQPSPFENLIYYQPFLELCYDALNGGGRLVYSVGMLLHMLYLVFHSVERFLIPLIHSRPSVFETTFLQSEIRPM